MVKFITETNNIQERTTMKCTENLVEYFIAQHFPKTDEEYQDINDHILNCKKCFEKLISLASKYNPDVEE